MTPNQKTRKAKRPKPQIPHRQTPDTLLDILGHILIMILLISQRPQQIQHFRPRVLALLAEGVFEVLGQEFEEIEVGTEDGGRDRFEDLQRGRRWVPRLPFEVVGDVAEEFEPVFGGPEERVDEHCCGVGAERLLVSIDYHGNECWEGTLIPVSRVLSKHLSYEVLCLVGVVAQPFQVFEIMQALDDVCLTHVPAILVVRVIAACEYVVEYAPQREYVNCSGGSSVCLWVDDCRLGGLSGDGSI